MLACFVWEMGQMDGCCSPRKDGKRGVGEMAVFERCC
jgi:hypothetical protein